MTFSDVFITQIPRTNTRVLRSRSNQSLQRIELILLKMREIISI